MKYLQLLWYYLHDKLPSRLLIAVAILIVGTLASAAIYTGTGTAIAKGFIEQVKNGPPVVDTVATPEVSGNEAAPTAPATTLGLVDSYWHIVGTSLKPTNSSSTYSYDTAGCMTAPVPITALQAPLNIPTGSVIKRLDVFYRNGVAQSGQHGTAFLQGYDGVGGVTSAISADTRPASTTGVGFFSDSSSLVNITVNNNTYGYVINWWPGGTEQSVCGIRVYYAGPPGFGTFLPSVER